MESTYLMFLVGDSAAFRDLIVWLGMIARLVDIREFLKEQVTKEKFQRLCETADDGDNEENAEISKRSRSKSSEAHLLAALQQASEQYKDSHTRDREDVESKEEAAGDGVSPFRPLVHTSNYFEDQIDKMLAAEMSPPSMHKDLKPLVRKTSVPPAPNRRSSSNLARANQNDSFSRAASQGYSGIRTSIVVQSSAHN